MDWSHGAPMLGAWLTVPGAFGAEVIASAGFDWCCVDLQHGMITRADLVGMLQALDVAGTTPVVRVPWNHPPDLMWALDAGAQAVIVPMVNNAEQARTAVSACRFAPDGSRSWGPSRAALRLGSGQGLPAQISASVKCLVMIETVQALEHLDEILAVPGVDGVFVGPSDLAVSMGFAPRGITGEAARAHHEAIEHIQRRCVAQDVLPGIYCGSVDRANRYRDLGYRLLAVCSDASLLRDGARQTLAALRPCP